MRNLRRFCRRCSGWGGCWEVSQWFREGQWVLLSVTGRARETTFQENVTKKVDMSLNFISRTFLSNEFQKSKFVRKILTLLSFIVV